MAAGVSGKTGSWWHRFPENWLVVAVSGKTGSWPQRFPEKLTHQTVVTYNLPQFHHFLPHNYFEITLATNCSFVTASVLMGNGLK
jgi:hypothetical protein